MAFDIFLADRVREYLSLIPKLVIEEKKMFSGLEFLVNGKMCVNISGQNLMCRFDPIRTEELAQKVGYVSMIMKGKTYSGFCYVEPQGIDSKSDFEFWINLCLDFNDKAKVSNKRKKQ